MKKLLSVLRKTNPCDESHSEDSVVWRTMSKLFPDCWCCAGVRGVGYGISLMLIIGFIKDLL